MLPQQYCLRWKYHHSNLQTMFSQLLDRGCFCDVTLACEGQLIRAHRVVLCACSTFFDTVLTNYASERDPIIIMKDVTFADIKCLIEFMYKGEINVEHANLASLLKTADDLKIKGLAEVTWRDDDDIPPPPTPQTEFHSPSHSRHRDSHSYDNYGHEGHHRSHSPDTEREQKTPSPKHSAARMPTLTPIPTSAVSIVAAGSSPIDSYLGPKRKRGRPPLDDAYDVFNVRKLAHYSDHGDSAAYLEGSQYQDESNTHATTSLHSRPNSPSSVAAAAAYQQHVQQEKQRLRYRPTRHPQQNDEQLDDESATEPEWITSSLEPENEAKDSLERPTDEDEELQDTIKEENDDETNTKQTTEKNANDSRSTPEHPKMKALKRKNSKEETLHSRTENENELEHLDSANVPQTVEEIETVPHTTKEKSSTSTTNTTSSSATTNNTTSSATSSSRSSPSTSAAHKSSSSLHHSHHSHSHSHSHHSHSHSHHAHAPPPPPLHHPHHYGKYVPEGYLINEHGILMTHDFIHAPTASIPTSSASNGHHPDDYVDIKMEEFNEAELRLTTEEMSQWQDVIKMDDYLAKGRRPQFWEEPFTRRVLDAIKNKRLEMKKAARILGVSYGTLYGRYREVYGCLKHPYSSTSLRPSQSSALTVQPRFDIVWPSPKPGQLDIGKLRPKDLSELWTRPQM